MSNFVVLVLATMLAMSSILLVKFLMLAVIQEVDAFTLNRIGSKLDNVLIRLLCNCLFITLRVQDLEELLAFILIVESVGHGGELFLDKAFGRLILVSFAIFAD